MALLYQAQLNPGKIELISSWAPNQTWLAGFSATELKRLGAYRFDDPEGEVGVEVFILGTADGKVAQVPLTYRAGPLLGAEEHLVGTMHHSVLGPRWAYDGCADPVYVRALATAILTGGTQAPVEVMTETGPEPREPDTVVVGSGSPGTPVPSDGPLSFNHEAALTVISWGDIELTVLRLIDEYGPGVLPANAHTLIGSWPGHDGPSLMAFARKI